MTEFKLIRFALAITVAPALFIAGVVKTAFECVGDLALKQAIKTRLKPCDETVAVVDFVVGREALGYIIECSI
jgi:hypothetical protein